MPTLITPERTAWRISSRQDLKDFCAREKIGWQLEANLAQLLGLANVGRGRTGGREREGYFRLDAASWFCNRQLSICVPVFGSAPDKWNELKQKYTLTCSLPTFKRLIQFPGRVSEDGWSCVSEPAQVAALADGASVLNIPVVAPAVAAQAAASALHPEWAWAAATLEGARADGSLGALLEGHGACLVPFELHALARKHTIKLRLKRVPHAREPTENDRPLPSLLAGTAAADLRAPMDPHAHPLEVRSLSVEPSRARAREGLEPFLNGPDPLTQS